MAVNFNNLNFWWNLMWGEMFNFLNLRHYYILCHVAKYSLQGLLINHLIEFFNGWGFCVFHYFELQSYLYNHIRMSETKLDIKVSEHPLQLVQLDMPLCYLPFPQKSKKKWLTWLFNYDYIKIIYSNIWWSHHTPTFWKFEFPRIKL